jgi:hypothetical protein
MLLKVKRCDESVFPFISLAHGRDSDALAHPSRNCYSSSAALACCCCMQLRFRLKQIPEEEEEDAVSLQNSQKTHPVLHSN